MARKMLINATRPEEIRVAIVNEGELETYQIATAASSLIKGNIYRGVVANIQTGMDAAFVDIGEERDALLRAEDIVPEAAHRKTEGGKRPRIDTIVERGKPVLVQVTRDPIDRKGAQVTTNVSLAGRYLVLMPFDDVRGVSRRTDDGEVRAAAREKLDALNVPNDLGIIVRTNALDQPKTSLNRDLSALQRLWKKIKKEGSTGKGTRLLYSDQDILVQALRDYLDSSIDEVLVDDDAVHHKASAYMASFMPRAKTRLVRYTERMPLFSRYQLDEQIDQIYLRSVTLPSGGSIVIDGTEALTAIDVNSGRGTRGANQEENALRTNLEAAVAVARQLRLRDIGGLVVVDFIDMRPTKNQRAVEKALKDAMKDDKARFTVGRLSPNGLLEINRQRIKKALQLRNTRPCPTCGGAGTLASPELVGLSIIRRIETRAADGKIGGARVALHPELADALQNDRRQELAALEREFDLHIQIIAATHLHRSQEEVEFLPRSKAAESRADHIPAVSAADLAEGISHQKDASGDRDDDEEESADKPKKRRRRGGRRRKKAVVKAAEKDGNDSADASEKPEDDSAGDSDDKKTGDDQASTKSEKAPRKRRRGGRRRKKSGGSGESGESSSEASDGNGNGSGNGGSRDSDIIMDAPDDRTDDRDPFAY
jgi:ribonuclease E